MYETPQIFAFLISQKIENTVSHTILRASEHYSPLGLMRLTQSLRVSQ